MITASNVANASPGELLCMTYKLFLEHIQQAIAVDGKARQEHVDIGLEIIKQLTGDINFEVELGVQLFNLYVYMQKLLINHKYDEEYLTEAHRLMNIISEGYMKITQEEDKRVRVMQNTENIYAGMTYGKGVLNEMVLTNINRGFRA